MPTRVFWRYRTGLLCNRHIRPLFDLLRWMLRYGCVPPPRTHRISLVSRLSRNHTPSLSASFRLVHFFPSCSLARRLSLIDFSITKARHASRPLVECRRNEVSSLETPSFPFLRLFATSSSQSLYLYPRVHLFGFQFHPPSLWCTSSSSWSFSSFPSFLFFSLHTALPRCPCLDVSGSQEDPKCPHEVVRRLGTTSCVPSIKPDGYVGGGYFSVTRLFSLFFLSLPQTVEGRKEQSTRRLN